MGPVVRRLRIAQVTSACHRRGGIERVVYELSKRFARDHEVHVFARTCELEEDGLVFHKLPAIRRPWVAYHLGLFLMAGAAVRREHARRPFDIVHVQGIPTAVDSDITTAHSVHCVGTDRQRALLPPMRRAWSAVKTADPLIRWLAAYNFRPEHCRRVIAISQQVKRDVTAAFGMPADRLSVIHNGVDTDMFSPARCEESRAWFRREFSLPPGAPAALFVGNEFQRKGLDVLLRALARMDSASRPHLIVVGDTRDPVLTLTACKTLCRSLSMDSWVRFAGAVADVEKYFAAADFLVLPAIYEPFGLVVLEALASGLPVVFSRCAGAADIVEDGREALLIENPADADEIAARVAVLARNPALRKQMGREARQTALRYTWDRVAARTLACYETILSQRPCSLEGAMP